jgi:hypothetical protein
MRAILQEMPGGCRGKVDFPVTVAVYCSNPHSDCMWMSREEAARVGIHDSCIEQQGCLYISRQRLTNIGE